jgi:chromosome segregation ATPase
MDSTEQVKLLQTIIEQQKAYIQIQEERMAEKDATIAELRQLVDELQSLKANLEETLNEFRRQFFGVSSEKVSSSNKSSFL